MVHAETLPDNEGREKAKRQGPLASFRANARSTIYRHPKRQSHFLTLPHSLTTKYPFSFFRIKESRYNVFKRPYDLVEHRIKRGKECALCQTKSPRWRLPPITPLLNRSRPLRLAILGVKNCPFSRRKPDIPRCPEVFQRVFPERHHSLGRQR